MEDSRHVFQNLINDILQNKKCIYTGWCNYAAKLLDDDFFEKGERHINPKDVVNELIAKVLVGERKWNMDKVTDINRLMIMLIRSYVSNLMKKEYRISYYADFCDNDEEENEEYIDKIHHTPRNRIQHELEMRENMKRCYDVLEAAEDYVALSVMEYLRFQYKDYDIAYELDIPINKVVNSKRRIKNILSKTDISAWAEG